MHPPVNVHSTTTTRSFSVSTQQLPAAFPEVTKEEERPPQEQHDEEDIFVRIEDDPSRVLQLLGVQLHFTTPYFLSQSRYIISCTTGNTMVCR